MTSWIAGILLAVFGFATPTAVQPWPLDVPAVFVRCVRLSGIEGHDALIVTDGRITWAMNGWALTAREGRGWQDVRGIWLPDVGISALFDVALARCQP